VPERGARALALPAYYFFSLGAFGIYLPFFPRWLEARHFDGIRMSAALALLPAMSIVAPPLFGWISDRTRLRGSLLRWVSAGASLSFAGLAVASLDAPPLYPVLLAALAGYALFRSPMTLIADVLALETEQGRGSYGRRRLWGSLGFLIAAVGTGVLVNVTHSWALPAVLALGYGLSVVTALLLPKAAPPIPRPVAGYVGVLLRRPAIVLFLATALLSQAAHSGYDVCFSLHLRDLGASSAFAGIAWAMGVLAEVGLMAFAPRLLGALTPVTLLGVGLGGAVVRWALLSFITSPAWLLALQPLHALSFAVIWVAALAHIKDSARPERLGTLQGLFQGSLAVGAVAGMLAAGPVYAFAGGSGVFAGSAIVALAGVGVWLALSRATADRREA
jgi:MFS transporter, PPP family, 3-phenylpropionic acid transporter